MKTPRHSRAGWAALSVALAAAWLMLLWAVLGRALPAAAGKAGLGSAWPALASGPAALAPPAGEAPAPLAASNTLSMTKLVDTGTGDNSVAFNGNIITYTIVITNNSAGFAASDILVIDTLPVDTLQDVNCGVCEHIFEEQSIPEPLGGILVITVTRQLSWTVNSLAPGASTALVFTGRVIGQPDGTIFKNRAFASFTMNNNLGSASTNETATTVRVALNNDGLPALASAPTWFSEDLGGTLSQDWGDFNNDGYLDLVLGSSVGTSVYRNENGILTPYWSNSRRTYGVRWADLNGDNKLDLATVGDSIDGTAVTSGTNYLYAQGVGGFVDLTTFLSPYQYVRVAMGDFDGDGDNDLIASTNSLNAACPVRLHSNNGAGVMATPGQCVSNSATAALGAGDFDNDGDLDLAIGLFPNTIRVLRNDGTGAFPTSLLVDDSVPFLPYDFAWGDYDGNGYMDLAAAFPLQKEARIYRNLGGAVFDMPLEPFRTAQFLSPLAVDWGDFSGDGVLDLVVADEEPKVYINSFGTFDPGNAVAAGELDGQVWSIRGAQLVYSADLELSLTNRDNPSHVIEGFAPHLAVNLTPINSTAASSLAWGDADDDGDMDVVLGAGPTPALGTRLLLNNGGGFAAPVNLSSGLGPQSVAFGDVNGDGRLDIAVGTALENRLYLNQGISFQPSWSSSAPNFPTHQVAFGDSNSDGQLDLLVGANGGGVAVFMNTAGVLATEPVFTTPETGNVRDLAWGDFNQDYYLDFVVAFYNQPARLYLNNKNNTYTSVWDSNTTLQTTSVSVADFNGDGYPDLALGHYGAGAQVYANQGAGFNGQLSSLPVWSSPTQWRTTAVAWGDWDYDGYPDLAVANDNDANQVFANLGSAPGSPRLFWLWTSAERFAATDAAWGDFDGDGDLDLGISSKAGGDSGYYRNGTYMPSHLSDDFVPTLSLANNPTYLAVDRPGTTADAYLYSASEIVGGISQTVTISYTLYDPDGSRIGTDLNAAGDPIARTYFEFSLDGGSTWKTASPAAGWTGPTSTTTRLGTPATFVWDALKDKAISDNARFRVRVAPALTVGPVQRASSVAVSPPFRVRGLTCVWPSNPFMIVIPSAPAPGAAANFIGGVSAGTGALTYTWDFGGGSLVAGQVAQHAFPANGNFPVTLTVTGEACPLTRPVILTQYIPVGTGQANSLLFLPLLANGAAAGNQIGDESETSGGEASPLDTPERAAPEATSISKPRDTATPTETPPPTDSSPPTETPTEEGLPTEAIPATEPATESPTETEPPTPSETPAGRLTAPGAWPAAWGLGAPLPAPGLRPLAATLTATQVTTVTPGINNEPALNGNGTRLAFWSTADPVGENPDGNIEVFLIITDSGGLTVTQISHSTGSILGGFNLATSIDDAGNQVVFFSDRDLIGQNPDNNFEVFLYDVPSDVLWQVTNKDRGYSILPSISGDGQYIAFASDRDFVGANGDGNTEIFRAQIGGGGIFTYTQVTQSTGGVNDTPRINQNGTRIAFVSNQNYPVENAANNVDNNREVFVAEMGSPVKLVQVTQTSSGSTSHPSISANGERVAFVSDRDPTGGGGNPGDLRQIYYAEVSPSYAVAVTTVTTETVEVGNDQPAISGDGTRIVFVSTALGQVRLADTLVPDTELVISIGPSLAPAVSSDGTALAFAHNRQLYLTSSPMAELLVSKTANPSPVYEGQQLHYTVLVTNAGPSAATNVRITETLPASGLDLPNMAVSFSGATCGLASQTVITCTAALMPAQSVVSLTVDVTPTAYGLLTNVVSASTETYERLTNNTQTVLVSVLPIPLESVSVNVTGSPTGTAHVPEAFVATVSPVTASVPLTYVWQATGQSTITTTTSSITNTANFTWNPGGVQSVTVTVSNAAAPVVSDTHVITIANPLPTIGALVPPTRTINTSDFTLVVTGTGYVSNSQALWDGQPLATTYVNSGTVNVNVTADLLTVLGGHAVTISNTTPGGGVSNVMTFTVNNPAPTLTNNSPLTRTAGGPTFTINLTGTNFVAGALLWWDGLTPLATFGSGTSLTASVPASYIAVGGTVNISVTNPSPSNGPSGTRPFTVTTPTLNLLPNAVTIGTGETTVLTATISAAQAQDTVITVTSNLTTVATAPPTITIAAGATSVTFTVQGEAQGGQANITGQLPASLGGGADITTVTVNYPAPVLTEISPITRTAGGVTFTLTLTGSNFVSGAQLQWGGLAALATSGSGNSLTATIPANYISTTGSVNVVVNNPLPNFGPSASQPFTVTALNISLTPDPLVVAVQTTPTLTITVDAVQAVDRTIVLTDSSPFLTTPPSVILPAGDTSVSFTMTLSLFRGLTAVVTATLPAAQGGLSDSALVTINNPVPALIELYPTTTTVGSDVSLVLTGTNFVQTSQVRWTTTTLTQTGFLSSSGLTATVPAGLLPTAGSYTVTVFNPTPSGGTSNVLTVTVEHGVPTITQLQPSAATVNGPSFTLVVTGSQFVNGFSTIWWGGAPVTTNFVNNQRLTTIIPASALTTPGAVTVTVVNGPPGGGTATPPLTFTIQTDAPIITLLTPPTRTVNTGSFTLVVTGSGFVDAVPAPKDSVVLWYNGTTTTTLSTTVVNTTTLNATVTNGDYPVAGVYTVTVFNPDPPGGLYSVGMPFTVVNPPPTLTALNPTNVPAGSLAFTLRVTGTGFISGDSVVLWNGSPLATTFVSGSVLTATVADTLVATPAWVSVTVQTAGPGGGTATPALSFGVDNLPATLTQRSPATGVVYSDFTLTVTGTGIVTGTQIRWMGVNITPTVIITPGTVEASIPQALYPAGGVYTFTLVSPEPPTGGMLASNSMTVTMLNPQPVARNATPASTVAGSSAFSLTINANAGVPNYLSGIQGYFNGQARTTTFISSTRLILDILQSDVDTVGGQVITLTNPSPAVAVSDVFTYNVVSATVNLTPTTQALLTLPATTTLFVNIPQSLANPTTISLTASHPLSVSIPPTVIDAGPTVTFSVVGLLPGSVVITAQLPAPLGGAVATATVQFQDALITGLNAVNNSPTTLGQPTTLTATITAGTNVSYSWTFGDGTTSGGFTTTNPITHVYPLTTTGSFVAAVTARNTRDTDGPDNTTVTIDNKPVILTMSPLTPTQDITQTITVTGTGSTFLSGAIVEIRNVPTGTVVQTYTTTYVNADRLTFQLSGLHFTNAGSFTLSVVNPPLPAAAVRRSDPFPFEIQ